MNKKSDDVIEDWLLQFFAIIEKEYGHAPERLKMGVRLKNGDKLRVRRTPLDAGGSGKIEVKFVPRSERSSES